MTLLGMRIQLGELAAPLAAPDPNRIGAHAIGPCRCALADPANTRHNASVAASFPISRPYPIKGAAMTEQATRYRKKPVVIEAWHFVVGENVYEIAGWCGGRVVDNERSILIKTLEGTMRAESGDYIICGVQGEFYPCKPDIFEATYEAAA